MSGIIEFSAGILGLMIAALFFGINLFGPAASLVGWMVDLLKSNFKLSQSILSMFGLFSNNTKSGENAQFAGFFDRYKVLRGAYDGLAIGDYRLSLNDSFAHLCLMAPTGAGKSTKYVIPNVLSLDYSMLITDPSGEIYKATSGHLARKGFKIKLLQPSDLLKSLRYNPLARVKSHDDVQKIVEILINSAYPSAAGDQVFWNNSAKTILSVLVKTLLHQPERYRNLHNLKHLLNNFGADGKALNHLTARLDEMAFSELRGFLAQDVKVIQSAISTAQAALQPFSNPDLAMLTAYDNLDFERMREEKTVFYIIIPEHEIKRHSFLLAVLYHQFFAYCLESAPTAPIFCMLDEFGNVGKLPNFSNLITTLRKRKVSVSLILQDQQQLSLVYGKMEAEVIINGGCQNKLFFSGLSLETCEQVSRILGKTITYEDIASKKGERSVSLLAPSEVRMMPFEIFLHHNAPPMRVNLRPFYKVREYKAAASLPAYRFPEAHTERDRLNFIELNAPSSLEEIWK